MSPDSLRRKFSLQGEDAQQWLAERGFLGEFDTTFRLVSDEIRFEGFGAARVWHSEGSYEIARRSPTALLIVQIEGESTLQVPTWGEASRVISPGDVAVLPGGGSSPFQFAATRPVARYQIEFDLAGLPVQARLELELGMVFVQPVRTYRDAVAATANIALNSAMVDKEAGFADFGLGLRHLTTALLLHALEATAPEHSEDTESLHRAALRVIAMRATDPDFTVEALARAIGRSPRNLRHIFAQAGSSAKAALTEERVRRARSHFGTTEHGQRFTAPEIAQLAGFRDVRALRRALAKDEDAE
ncbi:AraC-like DNA-binding protein [Rathayibacter agropyri]